MISSVWTKLCIYAIRFNYILWIQDLLDTTGENYTDRYDSERDVVGLDMFVDHHAAC